MADSTPTDELTTEQLEDYARHVEEHPDARGDENPDATTDDTEVPA